MPLFVVFSPFVFIDFPGPLVIFNIFLFFPFLGIRHGYFGHFVAPQLAPVLGVSCPSPHCARSIERCRDLVPVRKSIGLDPQSPSPASPLPSPPAGRGELPPSGCDFTPKSITNSYRNTLVSKLQAIFSRLGQSRVTGRRQRVR